MQRFKEAAQDRAMTIDRLEKTIVDLCALIGVATRCSIARCGVPETTTYQLHTNQLLFHGVATKLVPNPGFTGLTCLGPVPTEELAARYRGIS